MIFAKINQLVENRIIYLHLFPQMLSLFNEIKHGRDQLDKHRGFSDRES